ncbi:uncharacterized protein METZ01_LOCUS250268, partial [marine metagenome]
CVSFPFSFQFFTMLAAVFAGSHCQLSLLPAPMKKGNPMVLPPKYPLCSHRCLFISSSMQKSVSALLSLAFESI